MIEKIPRFGLTGVMNHFGLHFQQWPNGLSLSKILTLYVPLLMYLMFTNSIVFNGKSHFDGVSKIPIQETLISLIVRGRFEINFKHLIICFQ